MKKKLTASVLCLALLLIMLLGSTLAWFTDESGTTNTMTVGNVKIQQNETNASGAAFEQNQHMYPAVIKTHTDGKIATDTHHDGWGRYALNFVRGGQVFVEKGVESHGNAVCGVLVKAVEGVFHA